MEVAADRVVHEALCGLGLPARLVLEHHVVVPPASRAAADGKSLSTPACSEAPNDTPESSFLVPRDIRGEEGTRGWGWGGGGVIEQSR